MDSNFKFTTLADQLIMTHEIGPARLQTGNRLDVDPGLARKIQHAVHKLRGDDLLELAKTLDPGGALSTHDALRALHVDITRYTASRMIYAAAAAALLIIIAGRVQAPPTRP